MPIDLQGVIFDMDGVLVMSGDAHYESWRQAGASRGVEITKAKFLETFGQVNADCIPALFGPATTAAEIAQIAEDKEVAYRDIIRDCVPIAPGVAELLEGLTAAGLRCAVGSSAPPENVDLVLDAGGIRRFFSATVHGNDVKNGKPAPDVFLIAAERLGVEPSRCAVIEDAPAGITAARRAGMRAIGLATTHDADALHRAEADAVFADLPAFSAARSSALSAHA